MSHQEDPNFALSLGTLAVCVVRYTLGPRPRYCAPHTLSEGERRTRLAPRPRFRCSTPSALVGARTYSPGTRSQVFARRPLGLGDVPPALTGSARHSGLKPTTHTLRRRMANTLGTQAQVPPKRLQPWSAPPGISPGTGASWAWRRSTCSNRDRTPRWPMILATFHLLSQGPHTLPHKQTSLQGGWEGKENLRAKMATVTLSRPSRKSCLCTCAMPPHAHVPVRATLRYTRGARSFCSELPELARGLLPRSLLRLLAAPEEG